MTIDVLVRKVIEDDLPVFFEQQLDPEANEMAAFPPREREAFLVHWTRVLEDPKVVAKTILVQGQVAGNVVTFEQSGKREVGYWLGKEFWGLGVATRALSAFLVEVQMRPLFAHVAKHNRASVRVLEKCGFMRVGEDKEFANVGGRVVEGFILQLGRNDSNDVL